MFQLLKTWRFDLKDDDEKKQNDESDCDYNQEAIVHANGDLRQPIYEFNHKREGIVKCIGQLRCEYNYNNHNYIKHKAGTATAYDIDPVTKTVFAITCAHNVRHHILECAACGQWMELIINNIKVTNCISCKKSQLNGVMIQSNKIQFKRRSIKKNEYEEDINGEKEKFKFGDTIMSYQAHCEVVNDEMYAKYHKAQQGYDIAIISFVIDEDDEYSVNYYSQHSKKVTVDNGVESLKQFKTFHIFGYPEDKKENDVYKMFGQESSESHNYEIKLYNGTNKFYLKQQEIDTSYGQSGAAIWVKNKTDNVAMIVGVHTGGSPAGRFNVGALISGTNLNNISACEAPIYVDAVQCMGQIFRDYKYPAHGFRKKMVSFGTVYAVNSQKAFIITAGSSVRCTVRKCKKCDNFFLNKREANSVSHKCGVSDLEKHMIDPTSIEFRRKTVLDDEKESFKFGDTIKAYPTKCEYIPDKYGDGLSIRRSTVKSGVSLSITRSGHDFALLSFPIEDNETMEHYSKHTQNIMVKNGVDVLKEFTRLNTLYGLIHNKHTNDLGWLCSPTDEYEIKTNERTNMQYLQQFREGNARGFQGSGGSIVFVKDNSSNSIIIVGVHAGREVKTRKAIGTLICDEYLLHIANLKTLK